MTQLALPFESGESTKPSFLELFERELGVHGIQWCKGCDSYGGHKRGFVVSKTRTIHFDSQIARRATLVGGLHEIGHIVANTEDMRRWEREKKRYRMGVSTNETTWCQHSSQGA